MLSRLRHAVDGRGLVLHPHHNSLALMYQRARDGRAFRSTTEPFCGKYLWVHMCCSSGGTAPLWEDLQRSADSVDPPREGASPLATGGSLLGKKLVRRDAAYVGTMPVPF